MLFSIIVWRLANDVVLLSFSFRNKINSTFHSIGKCCYSFLIYSFFSHFLCDMRLFTLSLAKSWQRPLAMNFSATMAIISTTHYYYYYFRVKIEEKLKEVGRLEFKNEKIENVFMFIIQHIFSPIQFIQISHTLIFNHYYFLPTRLVARVHITSTQPTKKKFSSFFLFLMK